ncbi:hypothetical protein BDW22DRAFT_1337396, partial [Trametopsis cervina]
SPLCIIVRSQYVLQGVLRLSTVWESRGWIRVPNTTFFRPILAECRARKAPTSFQLAGVHTSTNGSLGASQLAANGAHLPPVAEPEESTVERFLLSGAQLSTISQSNIYRGLRDRLTHQPRRPTAFALETVRQYIHDLHGATPSDAAIWKATRQRTHGRPIQAFLWKLLHLGFPCGEWWLHIKGYEHRALCTACDKVDSMSHILTECTVPGQRLIWNCVHWMLRKRMLSPPPVSLGMIAGVNLLTARTSAGTPAPGTSRLLQVAVAESAYLIWKMRCERVIEFDDDSNARLTPDRIVSRWTTTINKRLALDVELTRQSIPVQRRLERTIVLSTWAGTLQDEHSLPDDWLFNSGVLVGRPELEPDPAGGSRCVPSDWVADR